MVKISCTGIGISIHSAARAETGQIAQDLDELQFQSTPPRGRRRGDQIKFTALYRDFNPLRREGGDVLSTKRCLAGLNFNPLRREGGDIVGKEIMPISTKISIHSAARAETISV